MMTAISYFEKTASKKNLRTKAENTYFSPDSAKNYTKDGKNYTSRGVVRRYRGRQRMSLANLKRYPTDQRVITEAKNEREIAKQFTDRFNNESKKKPVHAKVNANTSGVGAQARKNSIKSDSMIKKIGKRPSFSGKMKVIGRTLKKLI